MHRIRLRKPWISQRQPGGVTWLRRFGCPTGVGPTDRLWLVIENLSHAGTASLNGALLGALLAAPAAGRFDVTEKLEARNKLCLDLDSSADDSFLTGDDPPAEVFLEIGEQSSSPSCDH